MADISTSCTLMFLMLLNLPAVWIGQGQTLMTGFASFTRIISVALFLSISLPFIEDMDPWININPWKNVCVSNRMSCVHILKRASKASPSTMKTSCASYAHLRCRFSEHKSRRCCSIKQLILYLRVFFHDNTTNKVLRYSRYLVT